MFLSYNVYVITGTLFQASASRSDLTDRHVEGGQQGLLPVQGTSEFFMYGTQLYLLISTSMSNQSFSSDVFSIVLPSIE